MADAAVALPAPWWTRLWVGVVNLLAVVTGGYLVLHIPPVAHFVTYWTGQDDETGGRYGAWSGFLGSITPGVLVAAVVLYWRTSCHQAGCWLPGRHPSGDGSVKVCRWHHPDIRGRKLTTEVIRELHQLHLDRHRHRA